VDDREGAPLTPLDRDGSTRGESSRKVFDIDVNVTIEAIDGIGTWAGIGEDVLAASVLALGTSLPELSVTVRAAQAGNSEVAVGNVLGSNVFNALGVVGLPALIGPLVVSGTVSSFGVPVMLGVTVLCFFVLQEREMTRWDGWRLGLLYVAFLGHLYGVL